MSALVAAVTQSFAVKVDFLLERAGVRISRGMCFAGSAKNHATLLLNIRRASLDGLLMGCLL
jgi:hypothetical protein